MLWCGTGLLKDFVFSTCRRPIILTGYPGSRHRHDPLRALRPPEHCETQRRRPQGVPIPEPTGGAADAEYQPRYNLLMMVVRAKAVRSLVRLLRGPAWMPMRWVHSIRTRYWWSAHFWERACLSGRVSMRIYWLWRFCRASLRLLRLTWGSCCGKGTNGWGMLVGLNLMAICDGLWVGLELRWVCIATALCSVTGWTSIIRSSPSLSSNSTNTQSTVPISLLTRSYLQYPQWTAAK